MLDTLRQSEVAHPCQVGRGRGGECSAKQACPKNCNITRSNVSAKDKGSRWLVTSKGLGEKRRIVQVVAWIPGAKRREGAKMVLLGNEHLARGSQSDDKCVVLECSCRETDADATPVTTLSPVICFANKVIGSGKCLSQGNLQP